MPSELWPEVQWPLQACGCGEWEGEFKRSMKEEEGNKRLWLQRKLSLER